jgi:hypothetical protein
MRGLDPIVKEALLLLAEPEDCTCLMQDGKTALIKAAAGGHIELVRELLREGKDIDVNIQDKVSLLSSYSLCLSIVFDIYSTLTSCDDIISNMRVGLHGKEYGMKSMGQLEPIFWLGQEL